MKEKVNLWVHALSTPANWSDATISSAMRIQVLVLHVEGRWSAFKLIEEIIARIRGTVKDSHQYTSNDMFVSWHRRACRYGSEMAREIVPLMGADTSRSGEKEWFGCGEGESCSCAVVSDTNNAHAVYLDHLYKWKSHLSEHHQILCAVEGGWAAELIGFDESWEECHYVSSLWCTKYCVEWSNHRNSCELRHFWWIPVELSPHPEEWWWSYAGDVQCWISLRGWGMKGKVFLLYRIFISIQLFPWSMRKDTLEDRKFCQKRRWSGGTDDLIAKMETACATITSNYTKNFILHEKHFSMTASQERMMRQCDDIGLINGFFHRSEYPTIHLDSYSFFS